MLVRGNDGFRKDIKSLHLFLGKELRLIGDLRFGLSRKFTLPARLSLERHAGCSCAQGCCHDPEHVPAGQLSRELFVHAVLFSSSASCPLFL